MRTLGEKETYLGLLGEDIIKKAEMKEKIISEQDSFSKPNSAVGISSKE